MILFFKPVYHAIRSRILFADRLFFRDSHTLSYFLLILGLTFNSSANLYAQRKGIRFERISIEKGLSSSFITCIVQDSKGFMWFGTNRGLNRYDGYNFTAYKHDPERPNSLSHNSVWSLYEDQDGVLWVGTDGGLNQFDREKGTFTHYKHDPNNPNSLSHNDVASIYEDQAGVLWFGTWSGLNKLIPPDSSTSGSGNEKSSPTFIHYKHDPANPKSLSSNVVTSISEDRAGVLWVGTWEGLNKLVPSVQSTSWSDNEDSAPVFIHYKHDPNNPNSLSDNRVHSIYQDRAGMLWVGTRSGLNKLVPPAPSTSGSENEESPPTFIHYKHDPDDPKSLSNGTVFSIFEDQTGVLWVGTASGLNRYDREKETFTHYKVDPNNPNSLSHNEIWSIYEDRTGVLWVGTWDGLNKFHRAIGIITHHKHDANNPNSLSHNEIWSIYEDQTGALWVGTRNGLNKFDRAKGKFTHYKHDPDTPNSLSQDSVTSIYEDQSGILWVGTLRGGLNALDRATGTFTHYKHDPNNPNSISSNWILSIYEGRSGVLWVGAWGGLDKFDREKERFTHFYMQDTTYKPALFSSIQSLKQNNRSIASILEVGDLENQTRTFEIEQETAVLIVSMGEGRPYQKQMYDYGWIEKEGGEAIWMMDYKMTKHDGGSIKNRVQIVVDTLASGKYKLRYRSNEDYSYGTWNLSSPRKPELWGIQLFSITDDEVRSIKANLNKYIKPNSISSNYITRIYEDKSGTLWIGTFNGGLNKLVLPNPSTSGSGNEESPPTFIHYKQDADDPNSLSSNLVKSIYEDQTGVLWVGTWDGLNKFDRDKENFSHFTKKDGLPSDLILGITEDDNGNLWLSTDRGLSKFNPRTARPSFINYDLRDGLQGYQFHLGAIHRSRSGELFFGGKNGLNAFYPWTSDPHVPPIVITDFQVFNESVEMSSDDSPLGKHITETDEIVLSYKQNVFSFEFAALHYAAADKNKYAYRMEGFDKDWNYTDARRRYATYTNLDPGDYVFRVKASNNDGVWNEEGTSVNIIITPPFWKTSWFYLLAAGFFIAVVVSLYKYRVKYNIRRALEIERVRMIENERVRKKAAADFHDELGHQLTRISLFSEVVKSKLNAKSKEVVHYLNRISDASGSLLDDTRDFIWTLDPAKDSVYDVAIYLKEFGDELFDRTGIVFRVKGLSKELENVKLSTDWKRHLTLIFKEGVNNVLKHARCQKVTLEVAINNGDLTVTLSDDGVGFYGSSYSDGNGLKNMKDRAEKIGGEVRITSNGEDGTMIQFVGKTPKIGG